MSEPEIVNNEDKSRWWGKGKKPHVVLSVNFEDADDLFHKLNEAIEYLELAQDGLAANEAFRGAMGRDLYPERLLNIYASKIRKARNDIEALRRSISILIDLMKLACRGEGHDHDGEQTAIEDALKKHHKAGCNFEPCHVPIPYFRPCVNNQQGQKWKGWLADLDARVMACDLAKRPSAPLAPKPPEAAPAPAPAPSDVRKEPEPLGPIVIDEIPNDTTPAPVRGGGEDRSPGDDGHSTF